MSFRSRREPAARRPHPDPRVEAELQRILSLRKAITRKEDLAGRNHQQITALRQTVAKHPTWDGTRQRHEQIDALLNETDDLDGEITELHDEIAKRITALSDTDVAYL
jgi:uncharacterized coiled-coil DUF342 family protein